MPGFNFVATVSGLSIDNNTFVNMDVGCVDLRFMSLSGKDFHLQSTSPAIDAGMSISEVPNDY